MLPFTLRQLEYFEAIAAEGTLSAAAVSCNVSASALALALDELEHRLSLQLFVRRKGKGVTLTPSGMRLLSLARQTVSTAETLAAEAAHAATSLAGRFTIGCYSTLTPFFLPSIMQEFQRLHPQLELELTEADAPLLSDLLLQGRLDAALIYGAHVSAELAFDAVASFRPYAMVASNHRLAGRGRVHLSELIDEPLILLDVHPSRPNTEEIFGALALQPRIGHTTTSFELVRCLVGRGLGYGVLIQRPATTTTYEGQDIAMLELSGDVPVATVGLARPPGAPRTARYAALQNFLQVPADAPEKPGAFRDRTDQ
ncbi:LysR family transcriptional regulator [Chelativorans sp. ZYF759]|uniref:LysR substrate-binding domain-containing protein n=1 Tax=Chelativorans sp. ZYF759 TaxID=2692213 RepID=UPI00145E1FBB|nr:LysR substrate-binding domain-containing protein [Chelativorans sp. ZYF759]NMG38815.1 LysR family transcriptional regulator [Chelativorans sp. ZYF759]